MAFTGAAVQKIVADGLIRITGLSLLTGASGTIGLTGSQLAPGVILPAVFSPTPYGSADAAAVTMQDTVQVSVGDVAGGATANPMTVVKTGTTAADFAITLTNLGAGTKTFELYIKSH